MVLNIILTVRGSFLENLTLGMVNSMVMGIRSVTRDLARNAVDILNCFDSRKNNAILEGFNSKISLIKSMAWGVRNIENSKDMIYFCMEDFDSSLHSIM